MICKLREAVMIICLLFGFVSPALAEIRVTDLYDRHVTLEKPANRVLLGFHFEDFMAIVGPDAMNRVVAVSLEPWKDWRPAQYAAYIKAMPAISDLVDVGSTSTQTFSIEKALTARPDLVILANWQFKALGESVTQFDQAGIPIVVVDFQSQTLEKHLASILLIGQVMGADGRAKRIADNYRRAVEDVLERIGKAGPSSKRIYVELARGGPSEIGNSYGKAMWGGIIAQLRSINIASDYIENWGPLRAEFILRRQPDVIFLSSAEWASYPEAVIIGFDTGHKLANERIDAYLQRPGWRDLPAVKTGDIHVVYHGGLGTVFDYTYIQYLAKAIYPEVFTDMDPAGELSKFYEDWMPIKARGVFMMKYRDN